jgi:hypothetical protein
MISKRNRNSLAFLRGGVSEGYQEMGQIVPFQASYIENKSCLGLFSVGPLVKSPKNIGAKSVVPAGSIREMYVDSDPH